MLKLWFGGEDVDYGVENDYGGYGGLEEAGLGCVAFGVEDCVEFGIFGWFGYCLCIWTLRR